MKKLLVAAIAVLTLALAVVNVKNVFTALAVPEEEEYDDDDDFPF